MFSRTRPRSTAAFSLVESPMEAKQRKKQLAQRLCLRVQGSVYQREVVRE